MLKELFNRDNVIMTLLDKVADGLLLGLLWLLTSLPIFTIGASTTAAYAVALKLAGGEEGYVIKNFFSSFKKNFRQGTILGLVVILMAFVLLSNVELYLNVLGGKGAILLLPSAMLGFLMLFIMTYSFPLLAAFDNKLKDIIKNSVVIAIAYMPYTLMIMGIIGGLFLIVYYIYFPVIILIPSLSFTLSAYPLNKVFKALLEKNQYNKK
ncbi:YesL family protein [Alloiococcus sp. CFN-8]|uniref:YesL family protein n=1 Tax=Alloiococcus sp. CFN-8 TaxID=3416081 RepID=UPI003CF176F0